MTRPTRLRYLALEWPLLIAIGALLLTLGFQTWELLEAHAELEQARLVQLRAALEGKKLRAQLENLAGGTARLAAAGDANAETVVQQMQRLGVALHQKK